MSVRIDKELPDDVQDMLVKHSIKSYNQEGKFPYLEAVVGKANNICKDVIYFSEKQVIASLDRLQKVGEINSVPQGDARKAVYVLSQFKFIKQSKKK